MGKPYINNAVVGNGSMLGCISQTGELIRLYWPEIDHPQHLEKMLIGFFERGRKNSTIWFSEGEHEVEQRYLEDTNILETTAAFGEIPVKAVQTDFCLPDFPVMVRHYHIKNLGNKTISPGVGLASHVISHTYDLGNTLFDFQSDTLIHYRHDMCWGIGSSLEAKEFQIGNNPFGAVWEGKLEGIDSIGMSPDGAMLWDLGEISPKGECDFILYIVFSKTLNGLKSLMKKIKKNSLQTLYRNTTQYWKDFLAGCDLSESGNIKADNIYKRSLLLFGLMSDKNTGGLLASPEIDEGFTQCGRYAYCWCRDAAFITRAMDEAGLDKEVDRFYDWVVRVQDESGFWHQRYHMNGSLAPSWGIQIDETGTILFGILNHYHYTGDLSFLKRMWATVAKAVFFLTDFIDEETGLPKPSFDLWEERMGEHAYSTAAVVAGVECAIKIGQLLNENEETLRLWREVTENMRQAFEHALIDRKKGILLRSIRTKLNPWGEEPSLHTVRVKVNPKGFYREVTLEDNRMDISLLGAVVPFGIMEYDHPVVQNTVNEIERRLHCEASGGIFRYEEDHYGGGNPWVIATLWLALYYLESGNIQKGKTYFNWALNAGTSLDLLPEQVDKQDGKPCWVVPLTWSHAMYVLTYRKLLDNKAL